MSATLPKGIIKLFCGTEFNQRVWLQPFCDTSEYLAVSSDLGQSEMRESI